RREVPARDLHRRGDRECPRRGGGALMTEPRPHEASTDPARAGLIRKLIGNARARESAPAGTIEAAGPGERVMSYPQERMWVLEKIMPGYNTSTVVRVRGPLDLGALERGLALVVERHEVLRTVFEERDG